MTRGQRAGDGPIAVEVEKINLITGAHVDFQKTQFCDGSHSGTDLNLFI